MGDVGSPGGVGVVGYLLECLIFGFGSGDEVEEVHRSFLLVSVVVAWMFMSTRFPECFLGLQHVGGRVMLTWSVMVLPQRWHR